MISFCSLTGLPATSGWRVHSGTATSNQVLNAPDLLKDQQAEIALTCDCGATSCHQVTCSIWVEKPENSPPLDHLELVVCPVCTKENRLLRPLVLHEQYQNKIILRLPEEYRSRAYGVLSWWFESLRLSKRSIIPDYAMTPVIEFIPTGTAQAHAIPVSADPDSSLAIPSDALDVAISESIEELSLHTEEFQSRSIEKAVPSKADLDIDTVNIGSSTHSLKNPVLPQKIATPPAPKAPPSQKKNSQGSSASLHKHLQIPSKATPPVLKTIPTDTVDTKPKRETARLDLFTTRTDSDSRDSQQKVKVSQPLRNRTASEFELPALPDEIPSPSSLFAKPSKATDSIGSDLRRRIISIQEDVDEVIQEISEEELEIVKQLEIGEENDEVPTLMASAHESALKGPASSDFAQTFNNLKEEEFDLLVDESPLSYNFGEEDTRIGQQPLLEDELIEEDTLSPQNQQKSLTTPEMKSIGQIDIGGTSPLPEVATIARAAPPEALAKLRKAQKRERAETAVRRFAGSGVSVSSPFSKRKPLPFDVSDWIESKEWSWFFAEPAHQQAALGFIIPPKTLQMLDKGAELQFYIQLHRLPTYPLLVSTLVMHNQEGDVLHTLQRPMDIEEANTLIFLDILMQDFQLNIHFCTDSHVAYRDAQVNLPLEKNVEYLLSEARIWMESLTPSARSFKKTLKAYQKPDYDRLGKMNHNFSQDSFSNVKSPSVAKLAAGILSYWSDSEQFDYLIAIKSFPRPYFRDIQNRVLHACIEYGIHMPDHLMQRSVELGLGHSIQDILQQTMSSFAELNLHIKEPNDLDSWDNLENWQKLFNSCDDYSLEIEKSFEELAELAQRKCNNGNSEPIELNDGDEIEEFENFGGMSSEDLIELLQEPEYAMDAVVALCKNQDTSTIDYVAALFPQLERDHALLFTEHFILFGTEAEQFLLSWLHLPRPYQREAAMLALGSLGSLKAIDSIIKRLRSGEEWETAAEALGRIGEAAMEALERELKNKNWLIRLRSIKALNKINSKTSRSLIQQLANDSNEVVKSEVANILSN